MPDLVPCHPNRRFDDLADVHGASFFVLRSREELHVAHDPADAFGGFACVAQRRVDLLEQSFEPTRDALVAVGHSPRRLECAVGGELSEEADHEIEVHHDHRQRVVDLVCHARGEHSRRCHALRDGEPLTHLALRRTDPRLAYLPLHSERQPTQGVFEHIVLRACLHRVDRDDLPDRARHENEGNVFAYFAGIGERPQAVISRERVVRDDDVPVLRSERFFERALTVHALADGLEAATAELSHDELGVVLRVLDVQNVQRLSPHCFAERSGHEVGRLDSGGDSLRTSQ